MHEPITLNTVQMCMGSYNIKKQEVISCSKWKWKKLVTSGSKKNFIDWIVTEIVQSINVLFTMML
jgi:hypothetical protein